MGKELDDDILNLVKQKRLYPYMFVSDSENLKKNYLAKKSFIVPCSTWKLITKNMIMF